MSKFEVRNILVLDANQRSALAVTRSLGRHAALTIWTADSTSKALAGCSKYSGGYLRCPSPERQPLEFLHWLSDMIERHQFHAVFPVTEITSQLLLMNPEHLGNCQLPFADYETVMSLADKGKLLQIARASGVPVPEFSLYGQADEVDIEDFDTFPLVIKPCLSKVWTGTNWISTGVIIVKTREAFKKALDDKTLAACPFMVQSFIPGHGAGLFALYNHGDAVAHFAHHRIREKPPWGGVSVVSESVAIDQQLLHYADALLSSVDWHGVAMVEFRIGLDGVPYLMEVNTRFWGSLQLAIDSGVDFPHLLWQLCNDDVTPLQDAYVQGAYQTGKRLRWLLGDLDSLYLSLRDSRYSIRDKGRAVFEFLKPSGCRYEVNRWNDLAPAAFELREYIKNLGRLPASTIKRTVDPDASRQRWLSDKR